MPSEAMARAASMLAAERRRMRFPAIDARFEVPTTRTERGVCIVLVLQAQLDGQGTHACMQHVASVTAELARYRPIEGVYSKRSPALFGQLGGCGRRRAVHECAFDVACTNGRRGAERQMAADAVSAGAMRHAVGLWQRLHTLWRGSRGRQDNLRSGAAMTVQSLCTTATRPDRASRHPNALEVTSRGTQCTFRAPPAHREAPSAAVCATSAALLLDGRQNVLWVDKRPR